MQHEIDPIDALGDIREQIRAVQAQEQQLRKQLLAQGYRTRVAARFRVQIEEKPQKRFHKERLPAAIKHDPAFWQEEMRTYVRTFPLESAPKAHEAEAQQSVAPQVFEDEDFEVIEDWPDQNRKYRCAIGKTSAGSQVSNSPSARTS